MRFRISLSGWTGALIVLLSGCAQLGNNSQQDVSREPKSSETAGDSAGRATVRSASDGSRSQRSTPQPGPAVETAIVPAAAEVGHAKIGGNRAVTQTAANRPAPRQKPVNSAAAAIVEQELSDATPAEKQRVISDLDGLSPSNMRAVLKAWKLSRSRQPPSTPPGDTAATKAATVRAAGATEESTTTRIRKSLSAGLGTVTAWGTAIVTGRRPEAADRNTAGAPTATADAITTPGESEGVPSGPRSLRPEQESNDGIVRDLDGPDSGSEDPESSGSLLATLISRAESELAGLTPGESDIEREDFLSKHVSLRMLYLVSGRHELAMQAIPDLDPVDQEFWQHLFWGLANYFDTTSIPAADERAAEAAAQLAQAVLRLQQRANLELRHVTFCDRIDGFGNYDRCRADEFRPGQEVLLYAELGNIASTLDDNGYYRTSHASVIEIAAYGSDDDPVDRLVLPETLDLCRQARRDYFHSYALTIPSEIETGNYVLKLTVTDPQNRRHASYRINFRVAGPPVRPAVEADVSGLPGPPARDTAEDEDVPALGDSIDSDSVTRDTPATDDEAVGVESDDEPPKPDADSAVDLEPPPLPPVE